MNDETKISVSFKNNVSGEKKLKEYEERLKNIYSYLGAMNSGQAKTISSINDKTSQLNTTTKEVSKSTQKMAAGFNTAFNVSKLAIFSKALTSLVSTMTKYATASTAYIENINLLEVAYSNANETIEESSKRIETFIEKMSDVYGLDESRLTRQFGIFKQLANAMKLPTETAENLSELMVKMTNDIASLYNLDLDRASNALQSALAGQVRPIRGATGADITEKTLQNTVDALGLDRSINQLSYVEKRLIMVISLTDQLRNSQGDYARTIESASNQIRVMKEQWERLSRAVGNVFYPILAKVLPYLNAVLMVLTEIFNLIASLFGFKMPKFDYSGLAGTSDAVLDLEDSLDGASSGVDKLSKKLSGLRGFDKLNVINTPSSSGSASGAGGAGGIDPAIMDAFNDAFGKYNDMLDEVNMKARDIRNSILEWLGFSFELGESGEIINLKYEGISKTAENIYNWWKKLSVPMKVISALGLGSTFVSIYKALSGIAKLTGITQLFSSIAGIGGAAGGTAATIGAIAAAIGIAAYSLYDLYNSNSEFANEVNDMWEQIGYAIEPVAEHLQELWDNLSVMFTETLVPMFKELYEIIQELSKTLLEVLYPVFKDYIIPVVDEAIKILTDFVKIINKFWKENGEPIAKAIKETIKSVGDVLKKVWEEVLGPIFNNVIKMVDELWKKSVKPTIENVLTLIRKVIDLIKVLFEQRIKPVIDFLIDTVGPTVQTVVGTITDVVTTVGRVIGNIINSIIKILGGIIDFLTGIFTGNFSKAWDGITEIVKGAANLIIGLFEGVVNIGIDIINFFGRSVFNGVKSIVNGLAGIIEDIADFLGKDIDLSIHGNYEGIEKANFPRLQVGMDFVPKDFYGPVYLDYGERVLTKEQNRDYMNNGGNILYGSDKNKTQPINATFIFQVGDEELAKKVVNNLQDMAITNGKPITIGE